MGSPALKFRLRIFVFSLLTIGNGTVLIIYFLQNTSISIFNELNRAANTLETFPSEIFLLCLFMFSVGLILLCLSLVIRD